MATIKPFRAIRPNFEQVAQKELELDSLKLSLEPDLNSDHPNLSLNQAFLENLLAGKNYVYENELAIYVYECIQNEESSVGVFTLTSLQDSLDGKIITHEHTLSKNENQIANYRAQIGLEGAAVVLAHEPNNSLDLLINNVRQALNGFSFTYQGGVHHFWKVTSLPELRAFQVAFANIPQVYIADGHHRIGAAAALHEHSAQWIYSLYMSTNQLKIQSFHRLIIPENGFDMEGTALKEIKEHFYISEIPGNKPFRPEKRGRLGMCVKGKWYQLDLHEGKNPANLCDASFLQEQILQPIFGISSPRTDKRLKCLNNETAWNSLLLELENEPTAVAFTLTPMEMKELISVSLNAIVLPPKSTYITPKAPFGILMYHAKQVTIKA